MAQLQSLLERGVQVLHHELSGKVVESVLRYARVSNDLQLVSKHEGFFFTKETLLVSATVTSCCCFSCFHPSFICLA